MIIAWTSASTSKQSPMPGLLAIRGLRDILSRWATNGEQANGGDQPGEESELRRPPIVYHDDVMDQLFDAFEYLAVVSSESLQAQAFAEVETALSRTLDRLSPREQQRVADIVDRIVTTLGEHVLTRNLDEALTELEEALERNDLLAAAQVLRTAHSKQRSVLGQLAGRSSRVTKANG